MPRLLTCVNAISPWMSQRLHTMGARVADADLLHLRPLSEPGMPIWKLTPVDLRDSSWEGSSHKGIVIVRARDEPSARNIAATAFDVKTRFNPAKGLRFPPWKRPLLVKVEEIHDRRYEAEGPAEVLEPTL